MSSVLFWAYVKLCFSTNWRSLVTKEFHFLLALDQISIFLDRPFGFSIQEPPFVVKLPFLGFNLTSTSLFPFFFFLFSFLFHFLWFKLPFRIFTLNLFLFLFYVFLFLLLLAKVALSGFQLWQVTSLVVSSIILLNYVGIDGTCELFSIHFDKYQCPS